ncbi:hypothetical protein F5B19DRAFT_170892 [Rostrohypoxylon terebratum]|nr:hypothetical protein F5B19DRAFT_170892 [Rostrohypoxylon terebratum]
MNNRGARYPLLGDEDRVGNWRPEDLSLKISAEARSKMVRCSVCSDDVPEVESALLECGHIHCTNCVTSNAHDSLHFKPFMPAKCCKVILVEVLVSCKVFSKNEMLKYVDLVEEHTTPGPKLYCYDTNCNAFIPSDQHRLRVGECLECGKNTCKSCGKKSHFAACDPEHLHAAQDNEALIKKLASDRGWRQCPNCDTLIEKNEGCGHMLCYCGQRFCYRCGLPLGMGRDGWAHDRRDCPHREGAMF